MVKASRNKNIQQKRKYLGNGSPINFQQYHPTTWQKSQIRHKCKSLRKEVISWKYIFTHELFLSLMLFLSISSMLFLLFFMALKTSSGPAHWSNEAMFGHVLFFVKGHWSVLYWTMAGSSTLSSPMSLISMIKHFCSNILLCLAVGLESWYPIYWT